MFEIDQALWLKLSPILDVAIELPPEQRESFLDGACAGDRGLRELADSWLVGSGRPSILLDRPVTIPARLWRGLSPESATRDEGVPASTASMDSGAGRFLPGTIVGARYRIVSLLGRGGMGDVYRADDLRLGSPVAL